MVMQNTEQVQKSSSGITKERGEEKNGYNRGYRKIKASK